MKIKEANRAIVYGFGKDILESKGMQQTKQYVQHGDMSVFEHSVLVASLCVAIAARLGLRVDMPSLVRGALLHDYFLYDWHRRDRSRQPHAIFHAACALTNAERDFALNDIERNMIRAHMFPLPPALPRCRESIILCIADKICAADETVSPRVGRLCRKFK